MINKKSKFSSLSKSSRFTSFFRLCFLLIVALFAYSIVHIAILSLKNNNQVSHEEAGLKIIQIPRLRDATSKESNHIIEENESHFNPDASNHPILFLSDHEFSTISLSEMISWYGEAEGGGTCSDDFGNSLINRWRSTKKPYCKSNSATDSAMDCYLVHQTRHFGNGDNLCIMKNVSFNLGIFGDDKITDPVIEHYVATSHMDQPYIRYKKGFVQGNCDLDSSLWNAKSFPGWNQHIAYDGFETVNNNLMKECDEFINHNILIVQRDTFANFFHDSEDFINAFLSMAILHWNLKDTQIYLTDLYPLGPFQDIWTKVYGFTRNPQSSWDFHNRFRNNTATRTCFKNIATNIYGPAAPITVASWNTPCFKTALIRAYSDFIIRGLKLHEKTRYYHKSQKEIIITFMARRSSSEWPEKRFCSDEDSFFKCKYWESFGTRELGRTINNDKQLLDQLKLLESESFSNNAKVIVKDMDYNLLSFEEQIANDINTDIMIGPHGAGLMHNLFMTDRAALVEIFIDGSGGNRHFHNLAHWFGRKYIEINSNNPVNVLDIVSTVRNLVSTIDLNTN